VCMISTPWILVVYLPLVYLFYKLQRYFNLSSSELKCMEGISRSPVVTKVCEAINGLSTIRAFNMGDKFLESRRRVLDHHISFTHTLSVANQWFQLRRDWIASILIVGTFSLSCRLWQLTLSSRRCFYCCLDKIVHRSHCCWAVADVRITAFILPLQGGCLFQHGGKHPDSVERLGHFNSLDNEDDTPGTVEPPSEWPQKGTIEFKNYSMRYREHLDLVLKNVSSLQWLAPFQLGSFKHLHGR
ncbi:unnamed protein product, partial [Aphanomyces euteiches]